MEPETPDNPETLAAVTLVDVAPAPDPEPKLLMIPVIPGVTASLRGGRRLTPAVVDARRAYVAPLYDYCARHSIVMIQVVRRASLRVGDGHFTRNRLMRVKAGSNVAPWWFISLMGSQAERNDVASGALPPRPCDADVMAGRYAVLRGAMRSSESCRKAEPVSREPSIELGVLCTLTDGAPFRRARDMPAASTIQRGASTGTVHHDAHKYDDVQAN